MSGGVDSSVAAYLLKEQGYDVIGVTMQIWQDEEQKAQEENGGCCGLSAVEDARKVAWELGIPYYVMNFKKEFQDNVIQYFINEYIQGRTPNPCIACNRYVKWESLLKRSLDIGAEYIATGHYAQVHKLSNGRYTKKINYRGKRPNLCFVQSNSVPIIPYLDASRRIQQGTDSPDCRDHSSESGKQARQPGNLLYPRP